VTRPSPIRPGSQPPDAPAPQPCTAGKVTAYDACAGETPITAFVHELSMTKEERLIALRAHEHGEAGQPSQQRRWRMPRSGFVALRALFGGCFGRAPSANGTTSGAEGGEV
jgi:hypothetical protein